MSPSCHPDPQPHVDLSLGDVKGSASCSLRGQDPIKAGTRNDSVNMHVQYARHQKSNATRQPRASALKAQLTRPRGTGLLPSFIPSVSRARDLRSIESREAILDTNPAGK